MKFIDKYWHRTIWNIWPWDSLRVRVIGTERDWIARLHLESMHYRTIAQMLHRSEAILPPAYAVLSALPFADIYFNFWSLALRTRPKALLSFNLLVRLYGRRPCFSYCFALLWHDHTQPDDLFPNPKIRPELDTWVFFAYWIAAARLGIEPATTCSAFEQELGVRWRLHHTPFTC